MTATLSRHRRQLLKAGLLSTLAFQRAAWAVPSVQRDSRALMGTRVDITVDHPDVQERLRALDAAWSTMERLARMMNRYDPDSMVGRLDARAGQGPLTIPPEMMSTLMAARRMSRLSEGAFDVTIGAFSEWDFTASQPRMPTEADLVRERPLVDYRDLVLDEARSTAWLRRHGMRVDLGGIAKLPILAAGLAALVRHGVRHAMLNGGGDVLVMGQLQGQDWRIGLRDARAPERLLGVVALSEGFVASSGDYERCFVRDGRRYHHILDPHTGRPTTGPRGVTLISRDLTAINGLGAAIMASSPAWGRGVVQRGGRDLAALVIGHDHTVWSSDAMAQLLRRA